MRCTVSGKHDGRPWLAAAGFAAILGGWTCSPGGAAAEELPRFLPNHGNSVYAASGLFRSWPAGGPRLLWRADIGWGKSAVVEAQGRAFTATETDGKQYAVCLDPESGAVRWKRLLHPKGNHHFARGPVTSPVIDEDRVYFIPYVIDNDVWDMRCPVVCLNLEGEELWRLDQGVWATEASTPLVHGDTLYVGADNPDRVVLAALDKRSGAVRWTVKVGPSERGRELAGPASLTYVQTDGTPQVVVATYGTREVLGVHAGTGRVLWRYPYPAPLSIGLVSTPVAIGRRLLLSGGEGQGKNFFACLELRSDGGDVRCEERYVSTELQANMYNTPAVVGGAVFGFGGSRTAGFVHATSLEDGRLLWREAGRDWTKDQNLVVADGLMIAVAKNNQIVLADASANGYRERSRFTAPAELGRPQQPTIVNGRMYLRAVDGVLCYEVGRPARP